MRIRRCLLASLALLLVQQANGQPSAGGTGSRDLQHTILARKLLADDPDLGGWNIGVTVTDRVALLWGPVPSAEVAFRAELRLRTMIELTDVRNDLFESEALQPMRVPLKIDIPPQVLPDRLPPWLPADPSLIFGAPARLTGQDKGEAKKAQPASSEKAAPIKVLPPVKLDAPKPAPRKLPAGDPQPRTEGHALETAIRTLLHSKSAYRPVEFAVQDRRVYLKTTDADPDPLHEAARAISRLPNVDGVILVDKTGAR